MPSLGFTLRALAVVDGVSSGAKISLQVLRIIITRLKPFESHAGMFNFRSFEYAYERYVVVVYCCSFRIQQRNSSVAEQQNAEFDEYFNT